MSKKKDDKYKHSPARLYEFVPDDTITSNNVVELASLIRVGIGGEVFKKLSPELTRFFKEVA